MKSLVDGIGTLTKGGLVVRQRWDRIFGSGYIKMGDAAIMDVGRVVILGVEGKLAGESLA